MCRNIYSGTEELLSSECHIHVCDRYLSLRNVMSWGRIESNVFSNPKNTHSRVMSASRARFTITAATPAPPPSPLPPPPIPTPLQSPGRPPAPPDDASTTNHRLICIQDARQGVSAQRLGPVTQYSSSINPAVSIAGGVTEIGMKETIGMSRDTASSEI